MATASELRAAYNQKYGAGKAKGVSDHDLRANYNAMYGAGAAAQLKAGNPPTQPPQGILSAPPAASAAPQPPPPPPPQVLPGLTQQQNELINQTQGGDLSLGATAQEQLPAIDQAYSQPFDWQKYEQMAPVQGDYQNWVNQQMQNYNNAFDQRMNPQFQQQGESFEQMMANRGIPMGSELYNREKTRMEQSQNDARTQAYAQNQGQAIAGAQSLFNVGTTAQQNALGMGLQQRNMPLADYQALMGAQSGMTGQNLGFSQQMQYGQQGFDWSKALQDDAQKAAMKQLKYQGAHSGGGSDPYQGFGSAENFWAAQDARNRANMMWQFQNNPQYQQEGGPSYGAQLGGQILGTGLGILGSALI